MSIYLLVSFTFIALLFFFGELVTRNKNEKDYLLMYIFFSAFYFFFHSFLMHSNQIFYWKFFFLTPTPLLALLGPISERYLSIIFEGYHESFKTYRYKFIPTLIATFLVVPFYFRDTNTDLILFNYGIINITEIPVTVKIGVIIALTSLFYFLLTPLFNILKTIPFSVIIHDRKLRIFFLISTFISLFFPVLVIFTLIFNRSFAHVSISIYSGLILCFFFLLKQRNPDFFQSLQETVLYEKKYRKSQLANLDLENFNQRFRRLFEIEKVFLDENLSLGSLAKKLNLTNHQLSEYLNTVEQKQFYQIIAKYRVDEAKFNLSQNSKANLLEIAYSSGFNSKSSFNQLFKQFTGYTPTEYKKKMSKSNGLDDDLDTK